MESDGACAKNGKGFKEKLKGHFIRGASGYFSTASVHDDYYLCYGAQQDRLYRYPFTSLYQRDICQAPATPLEQKALREQYGIKAERVVVAVGSFIPRKGFDLLLQAAAVMPKETVAFIFVGGPPPLEYEAFVEEQKLNNVHFIGFVDKETVKDYMRLSDIFVLPTREDIWGLVINEAMAAGVPVITTDRCVAGLTLVTSPNNGILVPVGNVAALTAAIEKLLSLDTLEPMRRANLETIQEYTLEKMAQRHIER